MSIYEGFPIAMFDYRKVIGDGLYLSHIIVVSALLPSDQVYSSRRNAHISSMS